MPWTALNNTGNVRVFGNVAFNRKYPRTSMTDQDERINDLLVKLNLRSAEPLVPPKECPYCHSKIFHITDRRVKCQSCGKVLVRRETSTDSTEKGASE